MTAYGILISLGGLILAAIIVKGFWSGDSVKPSDDRDNGQNYT